jgi:hypothetical protein
MINPAGPLQVFSILHWISFPHLFIIPLGHFNYQLLDS